MVPECKLIACGIVRFEIKTIRNNQLERFIKKRKIAFKD